MRGTYGFTSIAEPISVIKLRAKQQKYIYDVSTSGWRCFFDLYRHDNFFLSLLLVGVTMLKPITFQS